MATTEGELAAERAVAKTTVAGFTRRRPERNTFPDHLPRERVVIDRKRHGDRTYQIARRPIAS